MHVLDYNPDTRTFFYNGTTAPRQCFRKVINGETYIAFNDFYPRNVACIHHFLKEYPGEDRAVTDSARKRILELKEDTRTNWVEKYIDLFEKPPYAVQKEGVEAMQHSERFALLFEQGLGKTYISLHALRLFRARGIPAKAIIICPHIMLRTWMREIEKFTPEAKVIPYIGDFRARLEAQKRIRTEECDIILTTYDMLTVGKNNDASYLALVLEQFSDEQLKEYADKVRGMLDEKGYATLVKRKKTKTWSRNAAKVLRAIPKVYLPNKEIHDVKVVDNTTKFFIDMSGFSVLIADEASRVISHTAQRTTAVNMLGMAAQRVYLLSGTLCVGRPTDMFSPMLILDKGILGASYDAFLNRYAVRDKFNRHIIRGYKNVGELKQRIDRYILARTREECLDLPPRTIVNVYYRIPDSSVNLYNDIAMNPSVTMKNGEKVFCAMTLQKIQKCLQVLSGFVNTGGPGDIEACGECPEDRIVSCLQANIFPGGKLCARKDVVALPVKTVELSENPKLDLLKHDLEMITPNEKIIVWAWYRYDLQEIRKLLDDMKIKYVCADEEDCAAKFEGSDEYRVFLGQTSQGIGITLNSATTTIYYSHGTALEPRLQSMDRNMRIGQTKPVVVRDYICEKSIEESIVNLLQHKQDVKEFIQKNVVCPKCEKFSYCSANGVTQYGTGCKYRGDCDRAEVKLNLQTGLLGIGGCDE